MTDQMITALIAAGSVLLGGGLTGIITLIGQRMTLKAADRKTQLEIADRDRTRFHEARKEAYAKFLAAAADAEGRVSFETVEKLTNADQSEIVTKPGFENFGPDAAMRMTRQQSIVQILSGSPEVRQASSDLVNAVLRPKRGDFWAAVVTRAEARERFMNAANKELTGRRDSSLTPGEASHLPAEQ
ncbi:hypothetical protein [Nonomuraea glycinis]|uniref:hypothetical protein n=1 Tax=Nonomuraea glycinis TaxID=2047744 RepID=UPI002E14E8A6|nr:hypothetical protein OHA68_00850 [Nonomuraea glycinis]